MKYDIILEINELKFEIIGIKVKLNNISVNIISFYLPPDNNKNKNYNQFNDEFFEKLDSLKPFILIGDLNCHYSSWYCKKNTTKGKILNEYLEKYNFNVINKNKDTFYSDIHNSGSVIDLMIISNDLSDKIKEFTVHPNDMLSDHFPISCSFNIKTAHIKNPYTVYLKK